MRRRRVAAAGLVAAAAVLVAAPAHGYEFAVRSRTIGQLYELRSLRLVGPDVMLGRRRFVQTLALDLWDIGGLEAARQRRHGPRRGWLSSAAVSFTTYLRLDHDFGAWTSGQIGIGGARIDAIDGVPELASSSVALDVLYGYVSITDIAGRVDLRLGRQVSFDTLDMWSMDGLTVDVRLPGHVAVEAFGGLRVRDASPLASAATEPDGTGGAACREYVEGPTPGGGAWQLVDRSLMIENHRLASDVEYCPQRLVRMPVFGAAVETWGLRDLHARVVYRRSQSRSVGLIDGVDRLAYPDLGYYPSDFGAAPRWAVNEERIAGEVRGRLEVALGGRALEISPWAAARWSLVHGLLDEATAGVQLRLGAHVVEPEVAYSVPTFDADSIFNVFAIAPASDARVSWRVSPHGAPWRAYATAWLRRYLSQEAAPSGEALPAATAGGAVTGVEVTLPRLALRAELLDDDGYGGRRSGGSLAARWKQGERLTAGARLSLLDVASDASASARIDALTGAAQGSVTWRLADGVAVHVSVETSANRYLPVQVRALGVLDLAFRPEM